MAATIKNHPILVTGASSGIGNHLTRTLAEKGYRVFATARKQDDLLELNKINNVIPVQLDVTDPIQVAEAVQLVENTGNGLFGLVNNAGIGELGILPTWSDEELFKIFDVNVFGVHRMTNAFVEMIIASKGRIVNIGSQGGMITKKYYGPYTMTKHALEAYTVALGEELDPFGVKVAIVQPGGVISDIGENSMPGTIKHFKAAKGSFKEESDLVMAGFMEEQLESPPQSEDPESNSNRKPSSPAIVTEAILDALFSENPKRRYLVGTKWEGDRVINALIEKLLDENDNPKHNYSREQLIDLLDQHIAGRNTNG
jgi:short-subunit dehydrogenase